MYGNNPNQKNPYGIRRPDRSPIMPGYRNPYHFGMQRVMGQLAMQPNRAGLGLGTNTTNPRRRILPIIGY